MDILNIICQIYRFCKIINIFFNNMINHNFKRSNILLLLLDKQCEVKNTISVI